METPSMNSIAITRGVESSSSTNGICAVVAGELGSTPLHRAALGREVELTLDRPLEFASQTRGLYEARFGSRRSTN